MTRLAKTSIGYYNYRKTRNALGTVYKVFTARPHCSQCVRIARNADRCTS